ncbi:MAG: hypothetical protein ACI4PL_06750 [Faecousia sp.]
MEIKEQEIGAESEITSAIGYEQLMDFTRILREYSGGTSRTRDRIISSENWWKLRNTEEASKESAMAAENGWHSRSAWMHNVITSKHADAMEAYPEPNILPREEGDKAEAQMLSSIIPCVLEQNDFETVYNDAMWQKCKTGTGCYKIVWDKNKMGGMGDISVFRVNLLNLYWEPGVEDIQKSRYFFQTELVDKDVLEERYPQLSGKIKGQDIVGSKFLYDDTVSTENKATVIEVYYHKVNSSGKRVLHYCKYVGDQVIYATENQGIGEYDEYGQQVKAPMAETGLYDHGLYPYVFDPLYPIEGSPCGYGYVDICRNPQTEIDLMKTSFVKNAMVGSIPRYFSRMDGNVNEKEFLDLRKPIVHVNGNLDEATLRQIDFNQLPGVYVNMLDRTIQELRETTGNTETSTGTASGVTAASAIAALQEASGKGSRDATLSSYRAYTKIVRFCIELIRQFYDLPRTFRILGDMGSEQYITYTNQGIRPQNQGMAFGADMGVRVPEFDIKVSAQKKNVYTKVSQNELALQFFKIGFFNPQLTDQALMCMEMMDFDGKDEIIRRVSQMGTMFQKLQQYMQMALMYASQVDPVMAQQIAMDMQATGAGAPVAASGSVSLPESDNVAGIKQKEHGIVTNARQKAAGASQPDGGKIVRSEEERK